MKSMVFVATFVFALAVMAKAETNSHPLVVVDSTDYGDTNCRMKIVELERGENTSLLKLTYEKMGSSVGSSMFIMRGFYEVAKARGTEYFINLKEWDAPDGGRLYVGGFTNTKDADIKGEFGDEFTLTNDYGQARDYMNVSDLDMLWGNRNSAIEPEVPAGVKLAPAIQIDLIVSETEHALVDYPARPSVLDDSVNLIPSEKTLVEAEIKDGKLVNLKQVDETADSERTITVEFTQNQDRTNRFMMLVVHNPFDQGLKYDASIQYYGREGFFKTSTLVVQPKMSCYESWPDPLTRILLKNFQLVDSPER